MFDFLFGEKLVRTTTTRKIITEASKKMYSEEDMRKAIRETIALMRYNATEFREHENTIIEQFKKK